MHCTPKNLQNGDWGAPCQTQRHWHIRSSTCQSVDSCGWPGWGWGATVPVALAVLGTPKTPTQRTTQDPDVPGAKAQHQVQRAEDAAGAQQRVGQADTHTGVVRELPL